MAKGLRKPIAKSTHTRAGTLGPSRPRSNCLLLPIKGESTAGEGASGEGASN